MKKFEAITALVSGEADSIKHRTSTFVLFEDSVVNARSKKALDMSNAHEDGWDIVVLPKWYEEIPETGFLCWLSPDYIDIALIVEYRDEKFFGASGDSWDGARPVSQENCSALVFDWEVKKKAPKKKAAVKKHDINDTPPEESVPDPKKDVPEPINTEEKVDDGVTITEEVEVGKPDTLPKQSIEPIVEKKDVIIDPNEEEIPF